MHHFTRAEINLDHLAFNLREIRRKTAPSQVIPVVKADAYGHGAVSVCRRLSQEGVRMFAAAQLNEARELRESGIHEPILIFGRLFPDEIPIAVRENFKMTLFCAEDLRWIARAGLDRQVGVHVNLDTGMGRAGVLYDQAPAFFDALIRTPACRWEGLYSHFATADESDKTYACLQIERFEKMLRRLEEKNARPALVHMANSGAVIDLPASYADAVRPGILLYGHYPTHATSRSVAVRQVMSFKTIVAHVRRMPAGHSVSYGRRWETAKETTIAVLAAGYADGIRRELTNRGEVLINERRYPMVGTVTMDYVMVDVGDDSVSVGDDALIWGDGAEESIQVLDVAEQVGTIPYELLCGVSKRVRRVYNHGS